MFPGLVAKVIKISALKAVELYVFVEIAAALMDLRMGRLVNFG